VLRPFREQVLPALWWPLQREGVFCCAAAAVVLWALGAMGGLGGLIADGIVLAYLFQIVRHTARGGDDFPAPGDFRGFFEDVVGPLFRILLASVWLLGPAMMWAFWSAQGDMSSPADPCPSSPCSRSAPSSFPCHSSRPRCRGRFRGC